MATNRATRRASTSKKKGPKKKTTRRKKGAVTIPQFTSAQKKHLLRLKKSIVTAKCRVADLDIEKANARAIAANKEQQMQSAVQSAMQAAGIDLEEFERGDWTINFDTMALSFTPAKT